jgi:hypothetical protein
MARSPDFPRTDPTPERATAARPTGRLAIAADGAYDEDERDEDIATARPRGRSYENDASWRRIGTLGVGLAVGVLVGAGMALLAAPMSGEDTRDFLRRGARRARVRATDRWDDLRDGLALAARRSRRNVRRGMTRGRWAWEDARERF